MDASGARLIIRESHSPEQEYPIATAVTTIGREPVNEVVLYDPEVSRRHAQISLVEGRYVIEDLGSTNGTFVNGRQISGRVQLNSGDVIDVGESAQMVFRLAGVVERPAFAEVGTDPHGSETLVDLGAPPPGDPPFTPQEMGVEASPSPSAWVGGATQLDAAPLEDSEPMEQQAEPARSRNRLFIGAGCLVLAIVVACAASIFILDAAAPDVLYCGPLESIFDLAGFALDCT